MLLVALIHGSPTTIPQTPIWTQKRDSWEDYFKYRAMLARAYIFLSVNVGTDWLYFKLNMELHEVGTHAEWIKLYNYHLQVESTLR